MKYAKQLISVHIDKQVINTFVYKKACLLFAYELFSKQP